MSAPPGWAWADPCLDERLGDCEADADTGLDVQPQIGAGASRAPSPTLEQLVGDSADSIADRGDGLSRGSPPPGTSSKTREDEDAPGGHGGGKESQYEQQVQEVLEIYDQEVGWRQKEDKGKGSHKGGRGSPGPSGKGGSAEALSSYEPRPVIVPIPSRCRPSDAHTALALGCLYECGRKANLPRFQTCCMACPQEHTGECALREGLLWCAHACGAKANLPRFDTCCRYCPRGHTGECALRQAGCPPQHPPPAPKKGGGGQE